MEKWSPSPNEYLNFSKPKDDRDLFKKLEQRDLVLKYSISDLDFSTLFFLISRRPRRQKLDEARILILTWIFRSWPFFISDDASRYFSDLRTAAVAAADLISFFNLFLGSNLLQFLGWHDSNFFFQPVLEMNFFSRDRISFFNLSFLFLIYLQDLERAEKIENTRLVLTESDIQLCIIVL